MRSLLYQPACAHAEEEEEEEEEEEKEEEEEEGGLTLTGVITRLKNEQQELYPDLK
jgi:hypothetical protein